MTLAERVAAAAARLDDDALAALASKGLVRRARKDVEAAPPEVVGERDGRLEVRVETQVVRLTERATEGRCDCQAGRGCRHVLAALMHLGRRAVTATETATGTDTATGTATATGTEILALTDEALRKWAGSALLRRAETEVVNGLEIAFTDGPTWVARLRDQGVECRWLAGAGLPGMLCGCHAAAPCLHRLAAILAWQVRHGQRTITATSEALEASSGSPRTREEVLAACRALTEEIVAHGLSRLSPASVLRARALAISAHGVDLPNLERRLRRAAGSAAAWLERSAAASDEQLIARCAEVHALAGALAAGHPELVGVHRARYERVREVELVGCGARVWGSPGGYRGLTVYFWERGAGRWNTWTDVRPSAVMDFDPVTRLAAPGPWTGCASPSVAARSCGRVVDAYRARNGRISGRASSRYQRLAESTLALLPAPMTAWTEVAARARQVSLVGLAEPDENAAIVLLRPTTWLPAIFDPIHQELRRTVLDAEGRRLDLVLPQSPLTNRAIAAIEAARPPAGTCVLGVLQVREAGVTITPLSFIGSAVEALGLDTETATGTGTETGTETATGTETETATEPDPDYDAPADPDLASSSPLGRTLALAWTELENVVAAGAGVRRDWQPVLTVAARLDDLGLARVAATLRTVTAGAHLPAAALRAAWVVRTAQHVVTVEEACARINPPQ